MGKKHKHPEHENHERWLVSYADFITLLFATFTALYAIATNDLSKLSKAQTAAAQAISQGFQEQSIMSGINSIMKGQSPPSNNPNPLSKQTGEGDGLLGKHDSLVPTQGSVKVKQRPPNLPTLNDLLNTLKEINQELQSVAAAQLSLEPQGVRITFDSTLLFDSGSAGLRNSAIHALNLIGQRLRPLASTYNIQIEGHTDNQPIASSFYPSNWELSTARACSVVRELINDTHIPARQMAAIGYADTRPKASNQTEAGRIKNRRIDIWIQGLQAVADSKSSEVSSAAQIKPKVKLTTIKPVKSVIKPIGLPKLPDITAHVADKPKQKVTDVKSTKPLKEADTSVLLTPKPHLVQQPHLGFLAPKFESISDLNKPASN